jgi:hypothetical protein
LLFEDSLPTFFFIWSWLSGLRTALENTTTQAAAVQTVYNSSQQELEVLQAAALEICREVEEGVAQAGSLLASRLCALGGMSPNACAAPLTWVSRRLSTWWCPTIRWTSSPCPQVRLSQSASKMRRR